MGMDILDFCMSGKGICRYGTNLNGLSILEDKHNECKWKIMAEKTMGRENKKLIRLDISRDI